MKSALLFVGIAGLSAAFAAPLPAGLVPAPTSQPTSIRAAPAVGRTAEDFALPDLKGNTVSLEALRKEGPVVVVFLRGWVGYQCPFCTQQVGTLIGRSGEFKEAHTRIVLIYPGPATEVDEKAKEFLAGKSLPETIFLATDAGLATVNAWNLRWDKKGETVYPSTFVVNTDGKVVFAKISHSHADRAATADVLKAIPKS